MTGQNSTEAGDEAWGETLEGVEAVGHTYDIGYTSFLPPDCREELSEVLQARHAQADPLLKESQLPPSTHPVLSRLWAEWQGIAPIHDTPAEAPVPDPALSLGPALESSRVIVKPRVRQKKSVKRTDRNRGF